MQVKSEDRAVYLVDNTNNDDYVIASALAILAKRMRVPGEVFGDPSAVKNYCALRIGTLPHEMFVVLYLDAQNRLIEYEELFRGTITQTSVYPREVVKGALLRNAASVVLAHNHPSGALTPSRADESLTNTLKAALALVDVRVIDHIIVSGNKSLSMAETGLL